MSYKAAPKKVIFNRAHYETTRAANVEKVKGFLTEFLNEMKIEFDQPQEQRYFALKDYPKKGEYPFAGVFTCTASANRASYDTAYFSLKYNGAKMDFTFYDCTQSGGMLQPPNSDPDKAKTEVRIPKAKFRSSHDNMEEDAIFLDESTYPAAVGYAVNKYAELYIEMHSRRGVTFMDALKAGNIAFDEVEKKLQYKDGAILYEIPNETLIILSSTFAKAKMSDNLKAFLKSNHFIVANNDLGVLVRDKHKNKSGELTENEGGKFTVGFRIQPEKIESRPFTNILCYNPKDDEYSDEKGPYPGAKLFTEPITSKNIEARIPARSRYTTIRITIDCLAAATTGISIGAMVNSLVWQEPLPKDNDGCDSAGIGIDYDTTAETVVIPVADAASADAEADAEADAADEYQ